MSESKIHNVRFYRPKPKGIYNMALNSIEKKLAVSRSDSTIEIWNLREAPYIERTITCNTDNYSIEGLSWYKNRLFSVGLHGFLVEYDLVKLCVKTKLFVTGEAAFCLDICEATSKIAIGTEQGYLNVFRINFTVDEIQYENIFDKQEGRILCLKYHKDGGFIASGSTDTIRVWCTETGHALHKMATGRSERKKPTIIWCLAFTENFQIISGDSRGKLTFWDSKIGSQLETYQSHRADILALCLSDDEMSLYASGIDPTIINYVKIKVKDGTLKWVKNIQRKIHDNDVRALILYGEKLYSGGIDGYLACSYHPPKTLLKYPPILQNPCVNIATQSRFILLRYPKCLEIWRLGEPSDISVDKNQFNLETEPKKILLIKKTTRLDSGKDVKEGIICANISQDGKWIIYSTIKGIRLLKFNCDVNTPELLMVEFLEENHAQIPCLCAEFLPNNDFVVAPNNGGLKIFKMKQTNPVLHQNLDTTDLIDDTITFLKVSRNGKYIIAADPKSNICVWSLNDNNYNYYCKLPKYQYGPTALAVHPKLPNLVVTYPNSHLIEYDLKQQKLTEFSKSLTILRKQLLTRNGGIRNITFDPRAPHIIILHDDSTIIVLNKNKKVPKFTDKIPKWPIQQTESDSVENRLIKKYKHLVHLSWLTGDELVAVEINPMSFAEQLPPCLLQNNFGRK